MRIYDLYTSEYINKPRGSLPGPVGACDFLLENECCLN